ncbi:MAG: putative sugar O-methyltransferase [candidate division Zixibacteria bacterium]|jgi:putative sugar O-methyltransferase|nr:putative sugar O-methyltransferase [candidate division Zixibacteria bacterium]
MDITQLSPLVDAYRRAPEEFHATRYWQTYEQQILDELRRIDITRIRSGEYPILGTFGFGDTVYVYHPHEAVWRRAVKKFVHRYVLKDRGILPYRLDLRSLQRMAYHQCELVGELSSAKPVSELEMSTFGGPADQFEIDGRAYSVQFLNFYVRYCFAHRYIRFTGKETVVELGSGSGTQIEVLKRLYPDLTILCFDMPAQLFLCEQYLSNALDSRIVSSRETIDWNDLSKVRPGHIHFLGNWQFPLLERLEYDCFWNAASFGEMEPAIVSNYLHYAMPGAKWVYLMQARHGKETRAKARVEQSTRFDDYDRFLAGFDLVESHDAWTSLGPLSQSGSYFEAIWKRAHS